MPAAVSFIVVPAAIALVAIMLWVRGRHQPFLNRFLVGIMSGFLATLVYDGSRWLIRSVFLIPFDPFRAHPVFGSLMLGIPETELVAIISGWIYHFYNGIAFGLIYALIAGPVRWPWAVAWSLTLEFLMILSYPDLMGVRLEDPGFLILSISGHFFWGVTLGLLVQRFAAPGRLISRGKGYAVSAEVDVEPKRHFSTLRIFLYFLILASIVTIWFIGLKWLLTHGFVTNIYAGIQRITRDFPFVVSIWSLLTGIALLLGLIIFRKRVVVLIPVKLQTLILPLPFYLLFTGELRWTLGLAAVGLILWIFHKHLAWLLNQLSPMLFPLVYVYLLTRSILQTIGFAMLLGIFMLFNGWMRAFFEPVWRLQSRLPQKLLLILCAIRFLVALSIPFVFSYSLGMIPNQYTHPFPLLSSIFSDNTVSLVIVSVFAALFVSQSPAPERLI